MEHPNMECLQFQSSNVYSLPNQTSSKPSDSNRKSAKHSPILFGFHLIVVVGLSVLGTFLQVEFYKAHDVLPGYAWPLAVSGAAGMLSLATIKFDKRWIDLTRKSVYFAFYLFMVLSSSYHVLSDAWANASKVVAPGQSASDHTVAQEQALGAVANALNVATKKGAWKVMESLGTAITKGLPEKVPTQDATPFGLSGELMIGVGAGILIVLRALLEAVQAITAVAVRNYLLLRLVSK
jgi:hypothetical protein